MTTLPEVEPPIIPKCNCCGIEVACPWAFVNIFNSPDVLRLCKNCADDYMIVLKFKRRFGKKIKYD